MTPRRRAGGRADLDDATGSDPDVGAATRPARPVDDVAAANEHVTVHGCLLSRRLVIRRSVGGWYPARGYCPKL